MRSAIIVCTTAVLGLILACGGNALAQGYTVPGHVAMTTAAGDTVLGNVILVQRAGAWDHWYSRNWYRTWRHWTNPYDLRRDRDGPGQSPQYPRGYDWYNRYCWSDGWQVHCY